MFTGIIEGVGTVKSISKVKSKNKVPGADIQLSIYLGRLKKGLKIGNSVSIDGVCLTITRLHKGSADFQLVDETVKRSCLGLIKPGDKVNIERSLRLGDRLEGHIVLGHVDTTGIIEQIINSSGETKMWIKINDQEIFHSIVPKGPLAVDGISLTVVDVKDQKISVALIPHTLSNTTLGLKSKGDRVNIEIDVIGRYVTYQKCSLNSNFSKLYNEFLQGK
ncbi:MAG TPA: riboflavin synthase [Nitrososphaeraceae archaeon]|nr:riboflavin synthase [Nitrososphaeraceae archaeon]